MKHIEKQTAAAARVIDSVLGGVIELNTTHHRVVEALRRAYERQSGDGVHRQQLERWLCSNPKKRQSPRLGTGINLALAAAAVLAAHKGKPFQKRHNS